MSERIEKFVDEAIKNNDMALIDVLWTLSYSWSPGYYDNYSAYRRTFKNWFLPITKQNLQKKYNLKNPGIKEKMRLFYRFQDDLPEFFYREKNQEELRKILLDKTPKILVQNLRSNLKNLSDLDKNILSFVIAYPIKGNFWRGDIEGYTKIFNILFEEELTREKANPNNRRGVNKITGGAILEIVNPNEKWSKVQALNDSFWQFGDELVKMGVGYWYIFISSKGNEQIRFVIPDFISEDIENNKEYYQKHLPLIDRERIKEIKDDIKHGLENDETIVSNLSERDIEDFLVSHPEKLEEGLVMIDRQYKTPDDVGRMDMLCRDKDGNFVVVELKKDNEGQDKAVGEIQRYMTSVEKNLAKNEEEVRGIIVVKEDNDKLKYSIHGSRFHIDIKAFKGISQ